MDRDHKIEKINAYKKLLETKKLPKISVLEDADTHHLVAKELCAEFEEWVGVQISILLGETLANPSGASIPFNDEEIDILKTLIAGVKARRNTPATEEVKARPAPMTQASEGTLIKKSTSAIKAPEAPLSEAERTRLNSSARPLGNKRMAEANRSNNSDALVSALERMDEEGPQY
jgi:hypothetical protein